MRIHKSAAVVALLVASCFAQTANKVVEPDLIGVILSLDPATQELKRLPDESWKRHASGLTKVTRSIRVEGPASTFRLAGGDKAKFVFGGVSEEAMKVKLYACSVNDGRREFNLEGWKGGWALNPGVTTTLARYGASSFKLTPDQPLAPGEYAIAFGPKLFTFGVDAAAK